MARLVHGTLNRILPLDTRYSAHKVVIPYPVALMERLVVAFWRRSKLDRPELIEWEELGDDDHHKAVEAY